MKRILLLGFSFYFFLVKKPKPQDLGFNISKTLIYSIELEGVFNP